VTPKGEGAPKGAPEAAAAKQQARGDSTPRVRPGVYARPLPLRARHLGSVSWWLRDQPWCEEHLRNLAAAWSKVYDGERVA
jgi:hypothetical protein